MKASDFFRYLLIGIAVAAGGVVFSGYMGSVLNGMEYGASVNLCMGVYLCVVVVVCTGLVLSKLRRDAQDDQNP